MGSQTSIGGDAEAVSQRYHVQKVKLGTGSFGTVWRAVDRMTGQLVAMKQLDKNRMALKRTRREDVEREIQVQRTCFHENLLRIYATYEDQRHIFLALEYCDNGDLSDKIREHGTRMGDDEVAHWAQQICAAIAELHSKGIVHRDIKPDNFLISGMLLKVSDFGLAICSPVASTLLDKCGTPSFMAPELHHLPRSGGYGLPVDIWAAGVSMYMLMSGGQHPFMDRECKHVDLHRLLGGELDFGSAPQDLVDQVGEFFGFAQERLTGCRFSTEVRELCQQMVCVNPTERMTADIALRHPWLALAQQKAATGQLLFPHSPSCLSPRALHPSFSCSSPRSHSDSMLPFAIAMSTSSSISVNPEGHPQSSQSSETFLQMPLHMQSLHHEMEAHKEVAVMVSSSREQSLYEANEEQQELISELRSEVSDLHAEVGRTSLLLVQRESEIEDYKGLVEVQRRELAAKDAQLAELRVKLDFPIELPQHDDKARGQCHHWEGAEASAKANSKWCTVL